MRIVDLSVVIVTYNAAGFLQRCLGSLAQHTAGLSCETIVVDNASSDETCAVVQSSWPGVRLLQNRVNTGFAAANNAGIREAVGRYVLLLNPDTEILAGTLQGCLRFMDDHPGVGIAGCRLLLPDGSVQQSVRSFPSVLNLFSEATFLYLAFPQSRVFGRYYMSFFDYSCPAEVDWVSGAFFLIRRDVIDRIGVLDERFFMYSEELDYCRRASHAGFTVMYTPAGTVNHFWGGVNAVNRNVILWTNASQILYIKKHHKGLERLVMLLAKNLGLLLRVPIYAAIGIVKADRLWLKKSAYVLTSFRQLVLGPMEYGPSFRPHDALSKVTG